jgi:hypothetical protein
MTIRGYVVAALAALWCAAAGWGPASGEDAPADSAAARPARADSAAARAVPAESAAKRRDARAARPEFRASPFDTIDAREFRERHAVSLDHFLETEPGVMLERRGPIGADADFSRYGIGSGRARLYVGDIPLNDPQDDRYPLAVFSTALVGDIAAGDPSDVFLAEQRNIEGAYRVLEPRPPLEKPVVAIEFSRGDRDLRQRRLRFSSIEAPIGVDFEFDELLNEGYAFDARGLVSGAGYGKSSTRSEGGNLRGSLSGGADYAFSFRRFTSVSDGDLVAPDSELRRDGHIASMRVAAGGAGFSVFERTHKASAPDSATSNHTAGVLASSAFDVGGAEVVAGAGYEDIHSRQTMGGAEARPRLQKAHAAVAARFVPADGVSVAIDAEAAHYFDVETGWGGTVSAAKRLGAAQRLSVAVGKRYRLPNLGELYQPLHAVRADSTVSVGGNADVAGEKALEAGASWLLRSGGFTNEIKATALRVEDPIFYDRAQDAADDVRLARNGPREDILVIGERAVFGSRWLGFDVAAAASLEYAAGDRARFFAGVPEYRATATAAVGRVLFKNTSGFRLSAEYVRVGSRRSGSAEALSPYGVLNLKIDVRLIDANLYAQWLNVTDESYQTVWPYLGTPLTFAYGIEWSIFD